MSFSAVSDSLRQVDRLLASGSPESALPILWEICDRTHLVDAEYAACLGRFADALGRTRRRRAAATVSMFLDDVRSAATLVPDVPTDLARCSQHIGDHTGAAKHFLAAGWFAHAAMALERAGDDRGARVLWERLADDPRLASDPYTAGLVRFDLGRACSRLGDRSAARRHIVSSIHLLEAAADGFEERGLRERAFDCFSVLLSIGRDGAFENLSEGYLNCIRVLKEDNLKYYVLQYYEDFQKLAVERGELHAAGTLFREAADYARRLGLAYDRHYRRRAAEVHLAAGEQTLSQGGPLELVENSYAAAIDAFNEVGLFARVREVYDRLAQLELAPVRKARYARLAKRLEGVSDESLEMPTFPEYLRVETAYPDVWYLDVVEWEQGGDPAETMAEVVFDKKWPSYTRRRALLARLAQLAGAEPAPPELLANVATRLGQVQLYVALAPLEKLYEHPSTAVRAAVLAATRTLYFKRSFGLVTRGLADPDATVRREALGAVGNMHFPHAFDPINRIYRESRDANVRRAALGSIGRISAPQAAEMLLEVLTTGDPQEQALCRELLTRSEHPDVEPLLKSAAARETGEIRELLLGVLRQRGAL
ncbi:MAG: HEAT repeat domain-containing protein [Deltaproteobacteria bacterium]|nr:HEAT repeat domain-containing protein [Deltaproteobacteria bacterium]